MKKILVGNYMDPVKEYIKYKRDVNEVWDLLDELVSTKRITKEALAEGITRIRELTLDCSLRIQEYFSDLDESELLLYVEAREAEYQIDLIDKAEKLDAITDLFSFVRQPSDLLVQAHKRHIKRLESL